MSLNMLGTIDQTFATGTVTITPVSGSFVDGEHIPDPSVESTQHRAVKQAASSEELRIVNQGGERYTDVARFFINDGSMHSVGSTLVDAHGNKYRIVDADARPERNYCRLLGASRDS